MTPPLFAVRQLRQLDKQTGTLGGDQTLALPIKLLTAVTSYYMNRVNSYSILFTLGKLMFHCPPLIPTLTMIVLASSIG